MADNKNNLEDFFKNRINDFDKSNDGWDLPDENAWENAQTYFPNYPRKKTWNWKLGILILLVFTLFSSATYIYYLKKDLTKKTNKIEIAENEIENKNNIITSLEKQLLKVESELNNEKLKHQNTITSFNQKEQTSTQTILSQKKTNQFLRKENLKLKEGLIASKTNIAANNDSNLSFNEDVRTINAKSESKIILEKPFPIASSFMEIQNTFPIQKLDFKKETKVIFPKQKKQKGKFELGLSYASMSFEIPLVYEFDKLEKENFGEDAWSFPIQSNGVAFQLAYEVHPNLWITSGLRRTTLGVKKSFSDKLIYNKSGEYLDDEGKTINEFNITTQSNFGDAGSSINFEIPDGTTIDDGEFLGTEWNYFQEYEFLHIPVGINYFVGKNKLKWYFKGGLGWNKISFGEHYVEAQLSYNNEILPIKENEEIKNNKVSTQFINGYAGVGLDYQLTSNWYVRSSFALEKNFMQKKEILESNSLTKLFDIGLNYRF